ncbi:MAG: mandelate racemase/muconate lactonizing enzyme family protein [Acidobacteria bacterium]|nr:mandelate racemase/muconate lactonizing enzyme family protein [Acidobacteriota bacterium]
MTRRNFLTLAGGLTGGLAGSLADQLFAAGNAPLKITKVEPMVIRTPKDDHPPDYFLEMTEVGRETGGMGLWNRLDHASPTRFRGATQATLVKITTDQGLVGWGESHAPAAPRVHQTVISDLFAPILLGQDARNVETLWEKLYSSQRTRGYATGFFTESIAGIDLALWDLLAKYLDAPLYRVLGGKYRDRIPAYTGVGGGTTEQLQDNCRALLDRGFSAVKMSLSKGSGTSNVDRVIAASEAIGDRGQLLIDSLGAYKIHEARMVGAEIDKLPNIGWWEDALLPEDVGGFAELSAALKTPVCAGEEISNRFQFRDLFEARAVDIINPDVCRAGGVSECRRIAILADVYGVLWSPHVSTGTALYLAASTHLAAHTPNAVIIEGGQLLERAFGNVLLKEPLPWKVGEAQVPERPGIGVEFDEAQLAKVRVS